MKKTILIIAVLAVFCGCKELKRSNPFDPQSDSYIGISYQGSVTYSAVATVRSLDNALGEVVMGASYTGYGDCVMQSPTGPPLGTFTQINDICADDFGNIYAVDHSPNVSAVSPAGFVSQFPLSVIYGIDTLYTEWFNNKVYVSNTLDSTITSYTPAGVLTDSLTLTVTASGYFTPGRIFASANFIYAADYTSPKHIVRLTSALTGATEFTLSADVVDGCAYNGGLLILTAQSVMQADEDLKVIKTWGNFGEGPGRILNGKCITFDPADNMVYVLDGGTLKKFGE